jgi:hypothetical protein
MLALTFVTISLAQSSPAQIARLSPAAFRELPTNLVEEHQRRGCTIPQETWSGRRNNVIKGAFAKLGQMDFAVLCSLKGISTILVFWNASEKNPAAIAPVEDGGNAQPRGIRAVGRDFGSVTTKLTADPNRRTSTIRALMMRPKRHLSFGIFMKDSGCS